jgi:hypothetical protein
MGRGFGALLRKDFKLMLSGKFFLLAAGSLLVYSFYINMVYVRLNQEIYPVIVYDPLELQNKGQQPPAIMVESQEELQAKCADAYAVGIDLSAGMTVKDAKIYMVSSGIEQLDALRSAYAQLYYQQNMFQTDTGTVSYDSTNIVGDFTKEAKNRREITCEVLFFELTAVGFLGLAAVLFREKQMGVLRVHGIVPVSCAAFLFSKLLLFFISDLLFAVVLTMVNIGVIEGMIVLPTVLLQAGLLSLIMALLGFLLAVCLPNFRQFSLLYLVLAVFITTPVFLVGQTGISWGWIIYHPMYQLFITMKKAYFGERGAGLGYYCVCVAVIAGLFLIGIWAQRREVAKSGGTNNS